MAKKQALDFTGVSLKDMSELATILKGWQNFIKTSLAYTFNPHPKQKLFFHPDRDTFPRFRVFLGGNRTGKSECGALEALSFALGEHPWDGTKTPVPTPNRGRIVGDALLGGIKTVIEPKIKQIWPADAIAEIKRGQIGNIAEVKFKNGSWVDILSCEQDPMRHEGADRDWCIEGNQLVLMASGAWKPIREIVAGDQVATTTNSGNETKATVHAARHLGTKDLVEIRGSLGFRLLCTPDHKIWVNGKEWRRADELKSGDKLSGVKCTKNAEKQRRACDRKITVREVVPAGRGTVYDIAVEKYHSFICNGVRVSNCWFDEPPTEAHWISNVRGLVDRGGYAWLTLTPLKEPWILDKIINKAKQGDPDYYYVQSSMYDNIGYGLKQEDVARFEAMLTEEERQVRLFGEFLALQGLVYKEYQDNYFIPGKEIKAEAGGHLIKPFEIPPHWPRFVGCDPHDRIPTMLLWMAVNEQDEVIVYDEYELPVMSIPEAAKAIKQREEQHIKPTNRSIMRIIDPAAARKNNVLEVGSNIKDMYMQNGIYFYSAINDLSAGHKAVRNYMRFVETNRGWRPRLFIFDTCKSLRHSILRYTWDAWASAKEEQKKAPKPKPTEKYKHFPDALRYVLVSGPRYSEPHRKVRSRYSQIHNTVTGY